MEQVKSLGTTLKIKLRNAPGIVLAAIVLLILCLLFVPYFSNPTNLSNILKNASVLLIVSIGMTLAILSGQIDMSIGGVVSASAMVGAVVLTSFEETTMLAIVLTVITCVAVGMVFGAFNGYMIAYLKLNYWLVTFASMNMGYGLAKIVTGGSIIAGFERNFRNIGDGTYFGLSSVTIVAIVVVGIMLFILKRTHFGMHVYAVGDSEQCASQSGIDVRKIRMRIYLISGTLAGLGGLLLFSKTNSANVTIGSGYEFDAIAAVIVGGTTFSGGKGGLTGTIIGALLIRSVKSALQLLGFNSFWQQTLIGLFILAVIVIDVVSYKVRTKKQTRRMYK